MHKTCECGYFMSDSLVPNHTFLRMYLEPISTLNGGDYQDKDYSSIFHCECCHRLHFYSIGYDSRYHVFWLSQVVSENQDGIPNGKNEVYILNDYDEVFKGVFDDKYERLFLEYNGKLAVFLLESIYEDGQMIYHTEHPERIIFDSSMADRSITAYTIRCSCGWLIWNHWIPDDDSLIKLYDDISWLNYAKWAFGEIEDGEHDIKKKGLYCERCRRLMIPDEHGKYVVYAPIEHEEKLAFDFSFLYYYVKPLDQVVIEKDAPDFQAYLEIPKRLSKIFISEDKKYLRVHEEEKVVFYQAEEITPGLKCTELPQKS